MTPNIKTYINKDDNSIKVCLNTNLDINEIDKKINQIESNIYLNRLKEQFKIFKIWEKDKQGGKIAHFQYQAMRLFCLDTQLISFNDIEFMEYEINNKNN